jgi:hypothetical protein
MCRLQTEAKRSLAAITSLTQTIHERDTSLKKFSVVHREMERALTDAQVPLWSSSEHIFKSIINMFHCFVVGTRSCFDREFSLTSG